MPVTADEQQMLNTWLNKNEANRTLFTNLMDNRFPLAHLQEIKNYDIPAFSAELVNRVQSMQLANRPAPVRRIFSPLFIKIAAAAAIVFAILGTYQYLRPGTDKKPAGTTAPVAAIQGASNKATLTLANGKVVELDALQNGQLEEQGGAGIAKTNEELTYNNKGNTVFSNTLSTPRGGKYKLVLADGTKVWMNSASSLTYPTAFPGSNRSVVLRGEAYFEVAKNATKPFYVQVNDLQVKVTGTHFNVNGYNDENLILTSLVEGGVQVTRNNNTQLLQPGQQAVADKKANTLVKQRADLKQVLSWKDGFFIFDGKQKGEILREISRWYNIDIEDKSGANQTTYSGIINRNLSLEELLDVLRESNVLNGKIVQRKLVILP